MWFLKKSKTTDNWKESKMTIQVTIGICMRNCEKDIDRIVENVSGQDFPHENIEVIFVDDGSEDNTLSSILKSSPRLNMKCKVFHHKWRGLGYSRNVVLRKAEGKYIIWIDDGIIISKNYIQQNVDFLEKNSNVGITKGVVDVYVGSNSIATLENMISLVFYYRFAGKFTTKMPGTGGSVYRVNAARQVGGFDENIQGANEDTDISFRMLLAGWRVYIVHAKFSIIYNERFKNVWTKNLWYGYGSHFILHKHRDLGNILYKSTPVAGFLEGIFCSYSAYKLTNKKIAFLLPLFLSIKRLAFFLGFVKSHFDSYGHSNT